jgi:hypothetical protein
LSGPMAAPAFAVVAVGAAVVSAGFAVVAAPAAAVVTAAVSAVVVFWPLLHAPATSAKATMPSTGTERFVRITRNLLEMFGSGINVRGLRVGYLDAR